MSRFVLCPGLRLLAGRLCCRISRLPIARPRIVLALAMACLGTANAYAGTCAVNALTDAGTGLGASGELRYCLNQLSSGDAASTNTITFDVTGTITLGGALPAINDGVTITGPGANLLTISGAGKYQVFSIGTSLSGTPSVTLSGLTIANGYSSQYSGGITSLSEGALTVSNCVFSGNTGLAGGAMSAAGVNTSNPLTPGNGTVTVTGSTFYGNFAEYGGAILAESLALTNSTVYDNSTYYYGAVTTAGTSTATDNTFYENSTTYGYGGGIYNANGTLTANNNIFSGNSIGYGVAPGSGGAGIDNGTGGTVNGSNNVYYNNLTYGSEDDCAGCTSGGPGSDGNIDAASNPLTLPFGYYGGPTETLALAYNSPAICAGSASLASSAGLTTDQRGFPLKAGNCTAAQVDAGSVQTNALIVTNLSGTSDASPDCTSGTGTSCSLVDALAQVSTDGSADVSFLSTLTSTASPGTISLSAGLSISGAVNLRGPGVNQLTVSGGNSASVGSVLTVNSGAIVQLNGLTVANGNNSASNGGGGGIDNSGTLTILDSAITANAASDEGGGIYSSGTLTMIESTVSGNSDSGGRAGGIYTAGTSAITSSTIAGNTDKGSGGGGIYVTGSLTLANSIVAGNNTSNSGANISGSYTGNGGNAIGGGANATNTIDTVTAAAITLSPLQLNGLNATVQTMIPLPGSAAICAGLVSNIPPGATTDERGYPNRNTSYAGYSAASPCVDAGAVQTNYTSVAFAQQPAGATASVNGLAGMNQLILPAPTVEVLETDTLLSGSNTDAVSGIPVTLNYSGGAGELMAPDNVLTETSAGGVATYALAPNTTGTTSHFRSALSRWWARIRWPR